MRGLLLVMIVVTLGFAAMRFLEHSLYEHERERVKRTPVALGIRG